MGSFITKQYYNPIGFVPQQSFIFTPSLDDGRLSVR